MVFISFPLLFPIAGSWCEWELAWEQKTANGTAPPHILIDSVFDSLKFPLAHACCLKSRACLENMFQMVEAKWDEVWASMDSSPACSVLFKKLNPKQIQTWVECPLASQRGKKNTQKFQAWNDTIQHGLNVLLRWGPCQPCNCWVIFCLCPTTHHSMETET